MGFNARPCRAKARRGQVFAFTALALAIGQASAQSAPAPADAVALDGVKVTGKVLSTEQAIAEKRAAPGISDGVSADEIGSIPDFGLGEAVQRIPGVAMTINNGRGEAQFLNLRGLNPFFGTRTLTLVDSRRFVPTSDGGAVDLNVIPSALIARIETEDPTSLIGLPLIALTELFAESGVPVLG